MPATFARWLLDLLMVQYLSKFWIVSTTFAAEYTSLKYL